MCDVNGFRDRSQAAYGCLALDYVADQLYQESTLGFNNFTLLIEMNDVGTLVYKREPLDWILFNKLLERQTLASPRSHRNDVNSMQLAKECILKEKGMLGEDINLEDLLHFALVILSDGKPNDKEHQQFQMGSSIITELAEEEAVRLLHGPWCQRSFVELDVLTWKAKLSGAKGVFNHAGLSATKLGEGFSSISSTMTLMQTELPSETVKEDQDEREVVKLKNRESLAKSMDDCRFIRSDVV
jgi:hypothetical protein